MKIKTVGMDDITVGKRFRKDVGDVDGLAESIKAIGLLHPVVVTPKLRLVAGFRRLTACKKLGWKSIPVRLLDIERIIDGEFIENVARKDFTLSEIAAIARELRPRVEADAKERRRAGLKQRWASSDVESCPDRPAGKSRDIIAKYVGLSGRSLDKIEAITRAADENPARKKEFHPWEQNQDEHRYLVEHLTQPGDVVVEFFGGSFGAAVVCRELGRRYHGADTNEECVSIGRKRVQSQG